MHFPGYLLRFLLICFPTSSITTAPITDHYMTMHSNIDEKENLARMERGELYYAFSPELVAARKRCGRVVGRLNSAGELSRREVAEFWKEWVHGPSAPAHQRNRLHSAKIYFELTVRPTNTKKDNKWRSPTTSSRRRRGWRCRVAWLSLDRTTDQHRLRNEHQSRKQRVYQLQLYIPWYLRSVNRIADPRRPQCVVFQRHPSSWPGFAQWD